MVSSDFLLDANVLSEPMRPMPSARLLERLAAPGGQLFTASIVWHELHFGLERLALGRRRDAVDAYLAELAASELMILPYDIAAARWHAQERARLVRAGRTPAFADGQIAAVARTNGLVLVTANLHDFEHFESLEVESWV